MSTNAQGKLIDGNKLPYDPKNLSRWQGAIYYCGSEVVFPKIKDPFASYRGEYSAIVHGKVFIRLRA